LPVNIVSLSSNAQDGAGAIDEEMTRTPPDQWRGKTMSVPVNAGARLDRLPSSGFHRRILWLIGLGIFFDSFDISLQAGVLGALIENGWSTLTLNAFFIAATFSGMAIGAVLAGFVGDRFGRRFAYQFNLLIFGGASLVAAVMPSMQWLIAARFVIGLGLGAEIVVGYAFVSEFVPPAARGRAISFVTLGSMLAQLVAFVLAYLLIPSVGWRWMFVVAGIGAIVVWHLRKSLPESPRWLEAVGRLDDAERVMSAIEREVALEAPLTPVATTGFVRHEKVPLSVLFSRPVIRRTLLAMLINIAVGVSTFGFAAWLPTFFVKQGLGISKSLGFAAVMAAGGLVGPLLGIWLSDRIGRKWGIVIAAISAAIFGMIYPTLVADAAILACGFMLMASILLLLCLGIGAYSPELFPTEYRLRGNGVANMTGRIATIFSPFAVKALFEAYGIAGVVGSIAVMLLCVAAIVAVFGIETRRKPLEAIDPGEPSAAGKMALRNP
jgi:putative MFS transporter